MKTLVKNYSYNATARTITFTDFTAIRLENILLVTDVTTGQTLYRFDTSGVGASVATNILTMSATGYPSGTANGDKLQIFYDAFAGDPRYNPSVQVDSAVYEISGAAAATNADAFSITALEYQWANVQVAGTFVGTLTFQVSNDGTNWNSVSLAPISGTATLASVATSGVGQWQGAITAKYFRVRMTAYTSGTATVTAILESIPGAVMSMGVAGTVTANQGTAATTQWPAAPQNGLLVADVASAAITTTTTTAAVTPNANVGGLSVEFNVIVTAVSGTNPTLDVGVEESMDNGTNWVRIFDFPRITAAGAYPSPAIRSQHGTRYRYVQTVGGTTPSFTRAINRLPLAHPGQHYRSFMDRSIVPNTLNSTTPTYNVEGCSLVQLVVSHTAATSAPTYTVEGSQDGTNWYSLQNGTYTPGTGATTDGIVVVDMLPRFVRARISNAGTGVTLGYVNITTRER